MLIHINRRNKRLKLTNQITQKLAAKQYKVAKHAKERLSCRIGWAVRKQLKYEKILPEGTVVEQLYRHNIGSKYVVCCKVGCITVHIVLLVPEEGLMLIKTIYIPNGINHENVWEDDLMTKTDKKM